MYNLSDFTPYNGKLTNGSEIVLAWDKKAGYHFLQSEFVVTDSCVGDVRIIGVKEEKKGGN